MVNANKITISEVQRVNDQEKIVIISGKLKYYLADLLDRDNMTLDQFTESISDMSEVTVERNMTYFHSLNHVRSQKSIGVHTQKFEYAASMKGHEWNIISGIVNKEIVDLFFISYKNIGYYLVYIK